MSNSTIKLVHTSDVHLDGRYGNQVAGFRNEAERAFASVVDVAIEEQADLLLIVGDLFDNNRVSEDDFQFVRDQLQRVTCGVVLAPGNHDVHDDNSVWRRTNLPTTAHIHSVLEHDGQVIELPELGVRIWGRAMAEHAPDNVPLHGLPTRQDGVWNIGLAHGLVVADRGGIGSSQITHDEIRSSGFDYLALGHVHVWGDMSQGETTAFYPGSPVAAYASAKGGHVAIATLHPKQRVEVVQRLVDSRD